MDITQAIKSEVITTLGSKTPNAVQVTFQAPQPQPVIQSYTLVQLQGMIKLYKDQIQKYTDLLGKAQEFVDLINNIEQ